MRTSGAMTAFQAKLVVLLAALALLAACTAQEQDTIIPPCTPVEGSDIDPCPAVGLQVSDEGPYHSIDRPDEPATVAQMLEGYGNLFWVPHMALRATFLPDTSRCAVGDERRYADYLELPPNQPTYKCYIDVRANEYYIGSGPSTLTVWVLHSGYRPPHDEALRQAFEKGLAVAGGYEVVLFIGPNSDISSEEWRFMGMWGLQEQDDDTVVAIHPQSRFWQGADRQQHIDLLEMSLADLDAALDAAHQARLGAYSGRIGQDADLPNLITDAGNLRRYYEEVGAYAEGTPRPVKAPPPCGIAAGQDKPLLMRDCVALLAAKDTLRGSAALDWDVNSAITDWEGITVTGTPQRVTKLELADKSLTGSIPAALARLDLTTLKLAGNSLTGCIPLELRNVPTNDLDDLGLPDCS